MKKIIRPRAIAKSIHQRKLALMKSLFILFFITIVCLFQTIAKAEQAPGESPQVPGKDKPQLSEECKSLISQMKELNKSIREKRQEMKKNGEKPKLELDEDGNPIFPAEVQAIRDQRQALKEQLKANNCPKPLRGKRKGKRKGSGHLKSC